MIRITPIIDLSHKQDAFKNIGTAMELGADGVFLYGYQGLKSLNLEELLGFFEEVKTKFGNIWVGICWYGGNAKYFQEHMTGNMDAIWYDIGVDMYKEHHRHAEAINRIFKTSLPNTLHFSEVSYLYTKHMELRNLKKALTRSVPYMDIICIDIWHKDSTKDIEILSIMSGVLPIAIYGNLTPENITNYLPYVDWCLPFRGIWNYCKNISPKKLSAFISNVREWERNNSLQRCESLLKL